MVTKKKKKYQLKYSLMLLLQKQYKLRLNFKVMKFTLDYYRIFYPKKKKKKFYLVQLYNIKELNLFLS